MFNDHPDASSAIHIAHTLRGFGVTDIMPTLITSPQEVMHTAVQAIRTALADPKSGVIGLHLEGPFINPAKRGCHPLPHIRPPTEDDMTCLEQAGRDFHHAGGRLLLTAAPEQMPPSFTRRLKEAGVILSAGHSLATFEEMQDGYANGFSGFTHLGNAMAPLSGREPGLLGAALTTDATAWAGLIADGHHCHPALIRLVLDNAQRGGCQPFLVSDAMPTVGSAQQSFNLFDTRVHKRGHTLRTDEGVLAGAHTHMAAGLRTLLTTTPTPREEALRMASFHPGQFIGLGHTLGQIKPGRRADVVAFDRSMRVIGTWVGGVFLKPADDPPQTEAVSLANEKT